MEEELLYHYTSLETLYAIISNIKPTSENEAYFTLRATHASFLNDLNEGRLLPEALKEIGINENKLWLSLDRTGYPFVLSLSELCDDLNMWRCYADQGEVSLLDLTCRYLMKNIIHIAKENWIFVNMLAKTSLSTH